MRAKILIKKAAVYIEVIALIITDSMQYAFGFSTIDPSAKGDISITEAFETKDKTYYLNGIEVKLWQAADVTSGARFYLTDDFKDSGIKVHNLTASQWKEAADNLLSYAVRNKIPAANTKTTGADGKVSFDSLKPGLYLVAPSETSLHLAGYSVTLEKAMLISVPYQTEKGGEWIYSVPVKAKNEARPYYHSQDPEPEPDPDEPENPDEPVKPEEPGNNNNGGMPPEKDSNGMPPKRDGVEANGLPKTGDTASLSGYMLILALSMAGLAAIFMTGKREENERDDNSR